MEPIRCFIAIELPQPIKSALSQLQDSLKKSEHPSVKWAAPEGIHLTLKFLGNVVSEKLPALTKAITGAVRGTTPFQLNLGSPGVFPNTKAPRVVWIGIEGEVEPLLTLHNNIEHALSTLGFPLEERAFSPHLTLGRVRESASPVERRRLGEVIASLKVESKVFFKVDSLSLMRSKLTQEGALYSSLASFPLG